MATAAVSVTAQTRKPNILIIWGDDIGMDHGRWFAEHMFMIAPAAGFVGQWLQSFKEFPPRQKPGSFNLDRVMEAVMSNVSKR